ncbi:hypothetical protein EDB89DRAFT_1903973 [Lactarius sanguifluus]|nr:hypothetical protein EDB89DRAFT_1903973 [Lactarius sanguifluus]
MPPRARRLCAGARTGSGPGPVPSPALPLPATPPAVQHQPPTPAPLPFPPSHAGPGGYPVPVQVGGGQYPGYITGLGMNAPPTYAQPHGGLPPPFHPHLNPYTGASNAQFQQWGYGHYPTGPFPNFIPNPGPLQSDNAERAALVNEAEGHAAVVPGVGGPRAGAGVEAQSHRQLRSCQRKTIRTNKFVREFLVEVDGVQLRQTFTAQTDMSWQEFEKQACKRFETDKDLCLGYRISVGKRTWVPLTSEPEWQAAITSLEEKVLVACTRAVAMELMDIRALVHPPKARGKGKGKEKRCRDDDIPPDATPEVKRQYDYVLDLQRKLLCSEHSTSGLRAYCWIEPSKEGVEGGHRKVQHDQMTLWAKQIVSKKNTSVIKQRLTRPQELKNTNIHLPPNVCKLDRAPPAKKTKPTKAIPEVHIAVNITPTPQGSYAMSGTSITPSGIASTSGPSHVAQVSDIAKHTDTPTLIPAGHAPQPPPTNSFMVLLLDCCCNNRVPTAYELLTLMDKERPNPNLRYADAHSDLDGFGYRDTLNIVDLDVTFLSKFGLGHDGARRVHQYTWDRFLRPFGLMPAPVDTSGPSGGASIEEVVAPTVQDVGQSSSEGEGECETIKKEVIADWLTEVAPGEYEEIEVVDEGTDVADEIEEDENEEDKVEEDEINRSDVASVTCVE